MAYSDDEYLALSGIQHYAFCRRQWSLLTIDEVWEDNLLTTLGTLLHERAHDESIRERRGDTITVRGLWVISHELGLSGICDVVEFHADSRGFPLANEEGLWRAVPVEYKHGKSKKTDVDRLQLCAQALCLEEMLCADIPQGYLYYGASHAREEVFLKDALRDEVYRLTQEMHKAFKGHWSFPPRYTRACRSCSLVDQCLPKKSNSSRVSLYIKSQLKDSS